ncbi:hypothetical protein PCI56_13535 [Plesiomonas shigelloides subsp. oncorhynchi]|nr:hypothetical protein [Plesiomonas shigelloides]
MSDIASLSVALRLNAATYQRDMSDAFQSTERKVKSTHSTIDSAAKVWTHAKKLRDSILDVSNRMPVCFVAGVVDRVVMRYTKLHQISVRLVCDHWCYWRSVGVLDKQSRQIGQTTTLSTHLKRRRRLLMASAKPDLLESMRR